jgi:hypothetical protein
MCEVNHQYVKVFACHILRRVSLITVLLILIWILINHDNYFMLQVLRLEFLCKVLQVDKSLLVQVNQEGSEILICILNGLLMTRRFFSPTSGLTDPVRRYDCNFLPLSSIVGQVCQSAAASFVSP